MNTLLKVIVSIVALVVMTLIFAGALIEEMVRGTSTVIDREEV